MDFTNNKVIMTGTVLDEPKLNHEVYSEKFYMFTLRTIRLSGMEDDIKVIVSERLMIDEKMNIGDRVCVEGQFRSHNGCNEDGSSKLMLAVFAGNIHNADNEKNTNEIYLDGYICKPPTYRTTPFGREIADLLIGVNRGYGKSDYIPVIVWGRNARYAAALEVGSHIKIHGRIQSRSYRKRIDEENSVFKTAYEVSANRIEPVGETEDDNKEA